MEAKKELEVALRPKRQVTIPREVCEQLGIEPGDVLELTVEGSVLIAKPKKVAALDALREIREAFRHSGITEKELQEAGREVRQEIIRESHVPKG